MNTETALYDQAVSLSYWMASQLGEHVDAQAGETLVDTAQRLVRRLSGLDVGDTSLQGSDRVHEQSEGLPGDGLGIAAVLLADIHDRFKERFGDRLIVGDVKVADLGSVVHESSPSAGAVGAHSVGERSAPQEEAGRTTRRLVRAIVREELAIERANEAAARLAATFRDEAQFVEARRRSRRLSMLRDGRR